MELIINPFIAMFILFIQYVVLMELLAKYGETNWLKPLVFIFIIEDYIVNWLITVTFLDAPRGLNELVTGRMKRYKRKYQLLEDLNILESWRYNFAVWLCNHLNRYDKGHC